MEKWQRKVTLVARISIKERKGEMALYKAASLTSQQCCLQYKFLKLIIKLPMPKITALRLHLTTDKCLYSSSI